MLLELAIGDAYGAGFEYAGRAYIAAHHDSTRYVAHPRHRIRPGNYTDDTQMSLAVAQAILSGQEWTPQLLADHFVTAFRRDPREGYAGGFYAFLLRTPDGATFLRDIRPDSEKSGAAMRAAPCGIFPTEAEVIAKTTLQARLTHDTPGGINSACAAALMCHYFLYRRGEKRDLGRYVSTHVPGKWCEAWRGKVGGHGEMSVRAALTALMRHDSLADLLRECIDFDGDVDTVAAIALAAASCSKQYRRDLPAFLAEELENGPWGRDFLLDLDRQLLQRVKR